MYVYVLLFSFSHAFLGRLLLAEETQSITDDTGRKKKKHSRDNTRDTYPGLTSSSRGHDRESSASVGSLL